MASNTVFAKAESSPNLIVHRLIIFGLMIWIFYQFDKTFYLFYAIFLYGLLSFALPYIMLTNFRSGIRLIRKEKFAEAIPYFKETADYFKKNAWVDEHRYITMFNASKRSMREIALCNEAHCLLQLGEVQEAKNAYEAILVEFPENKLAKACLKTISIISSYQQSLK